MKTKAYAGNDRNIEVEYRPAVLPETICGTGRWDNDFDGRTRYMINLSSILTKLIQESGRWCESYASDLFIMWTDVLRYLENPENMAERMYVFGMRASGVDDAREVTRTLKNRDYNKYRALWGLVITKEEEKVTARLLRLDRVIKA